MWKFAGSNAGVAVRTCCFVRATVFFCDENVAVAHYVCLPLTLAVNTTFSDGCLGSDNDEGRSEV